MDSSEDSNFVYPRSIFSLDGEWDFREDPENLGEAESWFDHIPVSGRRRIQVPIPFQEKFEDLRDYSGSTWYQKEFSVARNLVGTSAFVKFGAINYDPKIWVNGTLVGSFEGGYYQFKIRIDRLLKFGAPNRITVKSYFPPERILAYYPHGKQRWYGHAGGIWQGVELQFTSRTFIEDVSVSADLEHSAGIFSIKLSEGTEQCALTTEVFTESDELKGFNRTEVKGRKDLQVRVPINDIKYWSPDNPTLYLARVTLRKGKIPIDRLSRTVGFRRLEIKNGKICLNGKPILLRGALNQGFYPRTLYTPPGDDFIRHELELAKLMGLNLLRIHVKVEDERYLSLADRLGILIWEDLPHIEILTSDSQRRLETIFEKMIIRDRAHPSAIIWSLVNEAWGIDPSNPRHRKWLLKMYRLGKKLAPSGLIIDNSPCEPNYHVRTDIADFHCYKAVPKAFESWDQFLNVLASTDNNKRLLFGPNRSQRSEPILISEFGAWGLPDLHQFKRERPWWFRQGWGSGIPDGVFERFKACGLARVWKNPEELAKETQEHQFLSLQFLIETIRKRTSLAGYVITQFYDLHWESNGLLDFQRKPKTNLEDLKHLNDEELLFIDRASTKLNVWSGEKFKVAAFLSKWSEGTEKEVLEWSFAKQKGTKKVATKPFATTAFQRIKLIAPSIQKPMKIPVNLRLKKGALSTSLDILVVPKVSRRLRSKYRISIIPTELGNLKEKLRRVGYLFPDQSSGEIDIEIASSFDERISKLVENGGCALILLQNPGVLRIGGRTYTVEKRDDDDIQGYDFIADPQIFNSLPVERVMGWVYYKVLPNLVIRNVPKKDYPKMLAGYFEGWINNNGVTMLRQNVRSGTVLVTTMNFDSYEDDPVATTLLDNLIASLSPQNTGSSSS